MPYASIDDNMTEHPKVERLSDAAFRVYVTSICFCSRNLTDGLILRTQAGKIAATPKIIRELVAGGCWDDDALGWRVHDYLEWNKSRDQVLALKAAQKKKADARWNPAGNAAGIAYGNPDGNALPASPLPDLSDPSLKTTVRGRAFVLYEGMGWTINAAVTPKLVEIEDGYPADWTEDAFRFAAEARARDIRYIEKCLSHWKSHGRDCDCTKPRRNDAGAGTRSNDLRPQGRGNHRGKPEESGDEWAARVRAEQSATDRKYGRPDRHAPGAAADPLEQNV